nr:uncharacterized protein CTRU02_06213 [Colletotrichum truncatum]KAF6792717.1 hypothetical protein CTRU02_06213 [Colletotrichum truncatum]
MWLFILNNDFMLNNWWDGFIDVLLLSKGVRSRRTTVDD